MSEIASEDFETEVETGLDDPLLRFEKMREEAFAMARGEIKGDGEYWLAQAYAHLHGSGVLRQTVEVRQAA